MNLGYISKAIAAAFGAAAAILAIIGIGDGETIYGISQDAVMAVVTPLVAFLVTFKAPKNAA